MKIKALQFTSIIMIISILQGCSHAQPTREDVIGTWNSNYNAKIRFEEDSTFSGSNLPADLLWLPEYEGQFLKGEGNWEIKKDQGMWQVYLEFDHTDHENLKDGFGTRVYISGSGLLERKPPWYLFLWVREEGGERYIFSKK